MFIPTHLARLAAVGVVAAFVLAACGDDETAAPAAAAAAAPAPTTAAVDHSAHADVPTISVNLVDYAFENLPASVPAGTMLSITNESSAELHELVALRIPDEEQRSIEELAALPEADLNALFGQAVPAAVIIAPAGEAGFPVVGDGVLHEPGRYAVICAIPIGADPAEYLEAAQTSEGPPQVEGGPPHFTAGMYAELVVE